MSSLSNVEFFFGSPRRRWVLTLTALLLVFGLCWGGLHLWALHHYREAQNLITRRRFQEAHRHLERCLVIWPNGFQTHLLAGQVARRGGNIAEAQKRFKKCEELETGKSEELELENTLLRVQEGTGSDADFHRVQALADAGHRDSALILEALAWRRLKTQDFTDAMDLAQRWLQLAPEDTLALQFLAMIQEATGDDDDAEETCRRILDIDPDQDDARFRLAAMLVSQEVASEAAAHLEILNRRRPGENGIRTRLALCYYWQGRWDEAVALADEVLADDPLESTGALVRGSVAMAQGKPAEAEPWLRRAADSSNSYLSNFMLFRCLRELHREEDAKRQQARLREIMYKQK